MTERIRAALRDLMDDVDQYSVNRDVWERAEAALAEPEPAVVGPTDQELADAFAEGCRDGSKAGEPPFLGGARAVLARYGNHFPDATKMVNQPAPPAEGEVGELAHWLRIVAIEAFSGRRWHDQITRAADLLEQRHPAPVPVNERLPGPEDCDAEGRCWVHQPHEACPESPAWELMLAKYASPNYGATYWLPATALPLPAGEVQP